MRLLCFFLFVSTASLAQTPKYIIGKVLDQETGRGVTNASVINKRSLAVGRTNQIGNYYLQVKPGDSVVITSPTHGRMAFLWDGTTQQPVTRIKRQLADNVIELAEVTVRGKQEAELKRELEILRPKREILTSAAVSRWPWCTTWCAWKWPGWLGSWRSVPYEFRTGPACC